MTESLRPTVAYEQGEDGWVVASIAEAAAEPKRQNATARVIGG